MQTFLSCSSRAIQKPIFADQVLAAPSFERAVLLAWASGEVATLSGHCPCLLGFLSVLGATDGALCVPYSAAQVYFTLCNLSIYGQFGSYLKGSIGPLGPMEHFKHLICEPN